MIPSPSNPNAATEVAAAPVSVAELRRVRCKNCPKFFQQKRVDHFFCSGQCRKQFHRYGNAYGPLKDHLEKLVEKRIREQVRVIIDRELLAALAGIKTSFARQITDQAALLAELTVRVRTAMQEIAALRSALGGAGRGPARAK